MDLLFSQSTEFFDAQKRLPDAEMASQDDDQRAYLSPPPSPILIDDKSERFFGSPKLPEQLPYMRLLPSTTDKFYPTFNALIEDVNKTTSWQGYNVVKRRGNKKDKNRDLRKVRLGCSKRKVYKDEEEVPR